MPRGLVFSSKLKLHARGAETYYPIPNGITINAWAFWSLDPSIPNEPMTSNTAAQRGNSSQRSNAQQRYADDQG
jgi:hypothetical protein